MDGCAGSPSVRAGSEYQRSDRNAAQTDRGRRFSRHWSPRFGRCSGARLSFPITIKARWFPSVLRVWVEIGQPPSVKRGYEANTFCLRCAPTARIRFVSPIPATRPRASVPFDRWSFHPLGPGFNYEDLLEQQYFWPGQASAGQAKFGARDCDVIRSTPGESDRTHYAEVKTWIDRSIGFPLYVEKTVKETGAVKEFTSFRAAP